LRSGFVQSRGDGAEVREHVTALAPDRIRVDAKRALPCLCFLAHGLDLLLGAREPVCCLRHRVGEDLLGLLPYLCTMLVGLGLCPLRFIAGGDDEVDRFRARGRGDLVRLVLGPSDDLGRGFASVPEDAASMFLRPLEGALEHSLWRTRRL
jgi:hypothetical protein